MNGSHPQQSPQVLLSSAGRAWRGVSADFVHIPRGVSRAPASDGHVLGVHFGPPVTADCRVGDERMRGLQRPGDIGIIPAGVDGCWQDDGDCRILRVRLEPAQLDRIAGELGRDARKLELRPRFRVRDAGIDAICGALKAELEADTPSDSLYVELLADALAIRLMDIANSTAERARARTEPKLSARRLRTLTDFIESHLEHRITLADLAAVAGVGVTRLKTQFRNATGVSVHQYVIRRRVEYARALLATTERTASEIALASGFAHQSHLATTMRRLTGQTPRQIQRAAGELRPKLQNRD